MIACATIFSHRYSSKKLRLRLVFEHACAICTNRSQISFFCDNPFTFSPFFLLFYTSLTFYYIFFETGFLRIFSSEKEDSERVINPFGAVYSSFLFLCFLCFLLKIGIYQIGNLFIRDQSGKIHGLVDLVTVFLGGKFKIFG